MPKSARLLSIDIMRGLVIVLMALDHTRDYFSNALFSPTDLSQTNAAYFLTRWLTHLCAPTFVFLAGTGAFLSGQRWGISKKQLSHYLLRRGVMLIILELTVIRFGWTFNWDMRYGIAQVIWALGWSMVVLSGLIYLPLHWLTALSAAVILGHNLLDGIHPQQFVNLDWLWIILHEPGIVEYLPGYRIDMFYPFIPWFAVMAVGYCCGPLFLEKAEVRQRRFVCIGVALLLFFILLRLTNTYGDPKPWTPQGDVALSVFSFLNCEKYPPSLLYLLMTLGMMFVCLAVFESKIAQRLGSILSNFGTAPLLFYIAHIYLIHGLAFAVTFTRGLPTDWLFKGSAENPFPAVPSPTYGFDLLTVYGIWLAVLLMLYPLCMFYNQHGQK